jgi:hypothetical protein
VTLICALVLSSVMWLDTINVVPINVNGGVNFG